MPTIWSCPECGRDIYRELRSCPHCGNRFPRVGVAAAVDAGDVPSKDGRWRARAAINLGVQGAGWVVLAAGVFALSQYLTGVRDVCGGPSRFEAVRAYGIGILALYLAGSMVLRAMVFSGRVIRVRNLREPMLSPRAFLYVDIVPTVVWFAANVFLASLFLFFPTLGVACLLGLAFVQAISHLSTSLERDAGAAMLLGLELLVTYAVASGTFFGLAFLCGI